MDEELQLALLGNPEVRLGGVSVSGLDSAKTQALLYYLAVTGRPVSRPSLAGLLWGEMPEINARRNLRKALAKLRHLVAPHLDITRQTVGFNRDSPYWLDVEILETTAGAAPADTDLARLREAVDVYRGDFLEGFYVRQASAFEEWVLTKQTRLRELALSALHTLAVHYAQLGNDGRALAIDYTSRLLALEPWREESHRQMMLLLALCGRRGAALAQYKTCRQVLAQEFGVEPGAQTKALYERIQDGDLSRGTAQPKGTHVDKERRDVQAESPFAHEPPSPPPAFFSDSEREPVGREMTVFVAREGELARLHGYLDRALAGQGQVAFVVGGAGRGKTALLEEFARRAQEKRADLIVASGHCNAFSGIGDPYLPFCEILELLTGDVEARWAAGSISRAHARRLWALLPHTVQALLNAGPDLIDIFISGSALMSRARTAAPGDAGWMAQLEAFLARKAAAPGAANLTQHDLFAQYAKVLQALARQRPLLLLMDDLQWADTGSISLLFDLGRHLAGHRMLLVGAYRPTEVARGRDGERHPLEPVVNEFQRIFGGNQVNLGLAEGRRFVEAFLETEPNRLSLAFREALYQQTRGHPLFTVEMLHGMQEREDLVQDQRGLWIEGPDLDWKTLPARVEGVIRERISRLPVTLQETLKVASVEGEAFTAEVVAQVRAVDGLKMVRQLSSVLDKKHRLLRSQGSEQLGTRRLSAYRFRHILFQRYIYNSLDEVERVYLHEAVGSALERLYAGQTEEVAGQLARHFQAAGLLSKAIIYWGKAGDIAARAFANTEAIAHYSRALALAKQGQTNSVAKGNEVDEDLAYLYSHLGRVLELNSQFDMALANYEDMERLAQQRNDRSMELTALMARVTLHTAFTSEHDPDRGKALAEQALSLARELGDRAAEAKLLRSLMHIYIYTNKLPQAIDAGEHSLAMARELNLREQIAFTLNDLGSHCYQVIGRFNQAKEVLHEASGLWRELGNLPMLTDSLSTLSSVCFLTGEYDQALAFSEEAYQISQSINNLWGLAYSRHLVGSLFWDRGQPDQAIATMKESIRVSELAGFVLPQVLTRAELAAVYGSLGEIGHGMETVRLALSIAETQLPGLRAYALGFLAYLYLLEGDLTEAENAVDRGNKDPNVLVDSINFVPVPLAEGEIALRQGDCERALAVTNSLRQFGARTYIPQALYLQAQALLALGQDDAARDLLQEARAEAEAMGSRRTLWSILFALSQLQTDATEAQRLHQQAQEIVKFIADHIGNPELRASFLSLPHVQEVFEPIANE